MHIGHMYKLFSAKLWLRKAPDYVWVGTAPREPSRRQEESGSSPDMIGNLTGQQWNVSGVTPLGAFRKMNSDNCLFNANTIKCFNMTNNITSSFRYRQLVILDFP